MGSPNKPHNYFKSIQVCFFYVVLAITLPTYSEVKSESPNNTNLSKSEWIFWQSGSAARIDYETTLAQLALESSVDKYGPYRLLLNNKQYSAMRGHQ